MYILCSSSTFVHRYLHSFPTRRSSDLVGRLRDAQAEGGTARRHQDGDGRKDADDTAEVLRTEQLSAHRRRRRRLGYGGNDGDRKSTRLNSSHLVISYAVFCLKKKKKDS